jgi:hypothetical protein
MRLFKLFIVVFFFLIAFQFKASADKLQKGFEKLRVYDYFAAKEYFEKDLDDETAAAAFGLSSIYSTDKNPFYNPDSARRYILISDSTYKTIKEKKKRYYSEFGISDSSIKALSEFICEDAFKRARQISSVDGYNHFLTYYTTCIQHPDATSLRNAAAFNEARSLNTSTAYKEFLALYPQSEQYRQALSKFDERIFEENTADHTIESYGFFIQNFPESPYRSQAEKMIYNLSVPDKSLQQYIAFAREFKDSKYSEEAWREVYRLFMKDFSEESFKKFKETFPDYPFTEELDTDFRLQNFFFLPFDIDDKWGYINELGLEMIKPVFDEASLFADGLAVVSSNNKYGYINKAGKTIVDFQFEDAEPFRNDCAIVLKDSLYGLINKKGEFIIPPKYEELSEASDDIYIAVEEGNFGYINKKGEPLTLFMFDLANDFRNGYAIVSKNEKYGLINVGGAFNIDPKFDELVFISDGLLKAMNDEELWGIVNTQGDTILPFLYDAVGEFSEHRALVAQNEKCGYVDERGVLVIPITYRYTSIMLTTGQFQNGFAVLKQKFRSVIIDTTNKVTTFPGYDDYARPSEGFIPVRKYKKWGYTDMNGKIKIPCKYESADPFVNGVANIKLKGLIGLIDSTGAVFIPPLYESITDMEMAIIVRSNGKAGLLSRQGILLIPCQYDKIEFLTPALAKASDANRYVYINLDNGKIIYNSLEQ